MKFTPFSLAVGAVAIVLSLSATEAFAQGRGRTIPSQSEVNEAVRVQVQRNRLSCTVAGGRFVGRDNDGRTLYEIACQNAPGFLLLDTYPAQVIDCAANNASVAARRAENPDEDPGAECTLAENQAAAISVEPYIAQAGITCEVDGSRFLGVLSTGGQRFEVGCAGAPGYWIDVSAERQVTDTLECLEVVAAGSTCELTTAQERGAWIAAQALPSGRACTATDGRFVGKNADNTVRFYEVACSDGPGFMIRTNGSSVFDRVVECAAATNVAGGCTLTAAEAVAEATTQQLQDRLAAAGIACNYVANGPIRRETTGDQREVIEFKCADRPWGLVAFLPVNSGAPEEVDCLTGSVRIGGCALTSREDLLAALNSVIPQRPSLASCTAVNFQLVGQLTAELAGSENMAGDVVELRCASGEGYMVVIRPNRAGIVQSQTCAESLRSGGTSCELEG